MVVETTRTRTGACLYDAHVYMYMCIIVVGSLEKPDKEQRKQLIRTL